MKIRITCREASVRMSLMADNSLSRARSPVVWMHLAACRDCREAMRQMAILRRAFRSLGKTDPPFRE